MSTWIDAQPRDTRRAIGCTEVYTLTMTVNEQRASTLEGIDRKKVKRGLILAVGQGWGCCRYREQACSHSFLRCSQALCPPLIPCGSELARDSGGSACIAVECANAIASKLAPTVFCGVHRNCVQR
nr:hypothetical protein C1892_05960 [Pseudomonas sp. MPBD7-1]